MRRMDSSFDIYEDSTLPEPSRGRREEDERKQLVAELRAILAEKAKKDKMLRRYPEVMRSIRNNGATEADERYLEEYNEEIEWRRRQMEYERYFRRKNRLVDAQKPPGYDEYKRRLVDLTERRVRLGVTDPELRPFPLYTRGCR